MIKTPFGIVRLLAVIANGDLLIAAMALLQRRPAPVQHRARIVDQRAVLDWSWSPLQQRHRHYEKVTIRYYCQQADDAEWCFDHLRHFLVSWYPAYRGQQ